MVGLLGSSKEKLLVTGTEGTTGVVKEKVKKQEMGMNRG